MTDAVPLMRSAIPEDSGGSQSSYAPPVPPPKALPSLSSLPTDMKEREAALDNWTNQLRTWQANLEGSGGGGGGSGSSGNRPPNWPSKRLGWFHHNLAEIGIAHRGTCKVAYYGWFFTVIVLLFNAIAVTVLRTATAVLSSASEIAWAFALWFFFGSLASLSTYRLLYTALRKQQSHWLSEALLMSAIEMCVVAFCVAGIPGAGTSGIWLAVDAFRSAGTLGFASAVLCVVSAVSWLCLLLLRIVVFAKFRRARSVILAPQLGDDYLKMAGEEAGSFAVGDESDFAEMAADAPTLKTPQPPRAAPSAPEAPEGRGAESVATGDEDSDLFGTATSKKSKKTKKHRKTTTKGSKASPPPGQTPPPE